MQPDNALFGCRMLSSFISVVSAFIGDRLQRRHRGDRGLAPSGLAQALFKTVNHFILQLELFREYAGRHKQ
ncbi:hypothetical protein BZD79_17635 [Salmonella enterica]|nr:hypothetical protein [Salmonella enterica]